VGELEAANGSLQAEAQRLAQLLAQQPAPGAPSSETALVGEVVIIIIISP
jgi:hypothetical protein